MSTNIDARKEQALAVVSPQDEHRKTSAVIKHASLFGAPLTAWIGGVLKGPGIGVEMVDHWANQMRLRAAHENATDLMARETAIMLGRAGQLDQIAKTLHEQGLIDRLPSSSDSAESRADLFDQVEKAIELSIRINLETMRGRHDYAQAAAPTIRAEGKLALAEMDTRFAVTGGVTRAAIREGIKTSLAIPSEMAVGCVLGFAQILENATYATGKFIGTATGAIMALPFIAFNAVAEMVPPAARLAFVCTGVGMMIGGVVGMIKGHDITQPEFYVNVGGGAFFGTIGGLIVMFLAARLSRDVGGAGASEFVAPE